MSMVQVTRHTTVATEAGQKVVDPVAPRLEIVRATLAGNIAECIAADLFAHRNRHISNLVGLRMHISKFEMAAGPVDRLVPQLCECCNEFLG